MSAFCAISGDRLACLDADSCALLLQVSQVLGGHRAALCQPDHRVLHLWQPPGVQVKPGLQLWHRPPPHACCVIHAQKGHSRPPGRPLSGYLYSSKSDVDLLMTWNAPLGSSTCWLTDSCRSTYAHNGSVSAAFAHLQHDLQHARKSS